MKKIILLFATVILCTGVHTARGDNYSSTAYLTSLPDIPLMAGMTEIRDSGVVFDKAEGRIVEELVRAPKLTPAEVADFYNRVLPPLGWTRIQPKPASAYSSRFFRNGEQLVVNLDKLAAEGLVSFAVSPNSP